MHRVPTTSEVVPGALVNIVLKADQPTGRTVQGAVGQLLTRGNHPRGIKVRLTDGRVGRAQSIVGSAELSASQVQGEDSATVPSSTRAIGLDAYIKPAKQRGGARKARSATQEAGTETSLTGHPTETEESTCPVCGEFRGDVAALTHHVQSHFDD
ncbi:hypothetical protein C8A03DRAFT_48253 [Achaetomium macrosporum]|uniref:YwbE n=1 Tax=Achaetomium macrosporum TaxID=79813 RepID=A0AAN7H9C1_9PEZI|nr:hypothetical protein C8A03DRAFT_48253 [Achaetomium macrosporum]